MELNVFFNEEEDNVDHREKRTVTEQVPQNKFLPLQKSPWGSVAAPSKWTQPQPQPTKQSRVFHSGCRCVPCWVPVGGAARRLLTLGSGAFGAGPVRESRFVACAVRVVFSAYLYRRCSCFPLFAVLLNCPYPNPPVSASFFSFSSARRRGEGRPRGAFVASSSRNQNNIFGQS